MIQQEDVIKALSQVQEPDLGEDLVTLNMVKDINIEGKKVSFTVVLTTPACPLKDEIQRACENAVKLIVDPDADVYVHFDAEVKSAQPSASGMSLPGVKNIIAIASGKGGVGKSSIAVNIAVSLAKQGASVGLLDTDIYGPSVPIMMGVRDQRPMMTQADGQGKIVPLENYGVKNLSIGNLVDEKQAVIWRGPMASSAIKQFISDVEWGELDYLILDLPPGTGDIHLTLLQNLPITGGVIVTTPQKVAASDTKKGIMMFDMPQLKIPILGLIENMAYFIPPDMPEKKYFIFGEGEGKRVAEQFGLELLGEVPIDMDIRQGADEGKPAVLNDDSPAGKTLNEISQQVARKVAILDAKSQKKA